MSQEKVNRYKEEKANRKKNMKKEKARRMMQRTVVSIVCLALVGWFGYSTYTSFEAKQPKKTAEINYTAIDEYQQTLMTEE